MDEQATETREIEGLLENWIGNRYVVSIGSTTNKHLLPENVYDVYMVSQCDLIHPLKVN
ncbi:MAG: hypothetical protein ACXV5N_12215 [Halobacteriota archaeon]